MVYKLGFQCLRGAIKSPPQWANGWSCMAKHAERFAMVLLPPHIVHHTTVQCIWRALLQNEESHENHISCPHLPLC